MIRWKNSHQNWNLNWMLRTGAMEIFARIRKSERTKELYFRK